MENWKIGYNHCIQLLLLVSAMQITGMIYQPEIYGLVFFIFIGISSQIHSQYHFVSIIDLIYTSRNNIMMISDYRKYLCTVYTNKFHIIFCTVFDSITAD